MNIEAPMAVTSALLLLQLVLGSVRRRTRSQLIQLVLWLSYTLHPPLTAYTIGLMQSSSPPAKTGVPALYPVWALSLLLLAGGANSVTAFDLGDNAHWRRRVIFYLQSFVLFSILCRRHLPAGAATVPFVFVSTIAISSHVSGFVVSWMAGDPGPSKAVADYMKDHANSSRSSSQDDQGFDPVTMKGCKYLVHWPHGNEQAPRGSCELVPKKEDVVTLDMIWEKFSEAPLAGAGAAGSRIRGACLSYAMSHLLKRRFFGLDCAEAGRAETMRFILDGLLSENNTDEHTEAFRVIEVELGFLYDFFYTKYACIFNGEIRFLLMAVLKIILTFLLGSALLFHSPEILIRTRTEDIVFTFLVLGMFIAVEASHTVMYLGSDWAMVSLACRSLTSSTPNRLVAFTFSKPLQLLTKHPLFRHWHNSIGQCSVIQDSEFLPHTKAKSSAPQLASTFMFSAASKYIDQTLDNLIPRKCCRYVKLPDMLKPQIVSFLKSNSDGNPLTNGKASLQGNSVLEQFSWTLQDQTQTESMLIWHIATEYIRIILSEEVEGGRRLSSYENRQVAVKLSLYCAYLMSDAPELLPGNPLDTKLAFEDAMYKAGKALGSRKRTKAILRKASNRTRDAGSIFNKGLKLGTELASMEDGSLRWKVMAEFWVETILYVAPSDNARAHMERLAQGGEFLTHIWALLTHAGVLTRCDPELIHG